MTTLILILLLVLIAVVIGGVITLRKAIHKQTVALGRAYGNVNDLHDGLVKVLGDMKHDLRSDLLEMTTAITKAFMEETIEIKQALEIIVAGPEDLTKDRCFEKDCQRNGEVEVKVAVDGGEARVHAYCEPHAREMVKEAFKVPGAKGRFEGVSKDGTPFAQSFDNSVCSDGYDHSNDPDYIPGQIHAHVEIPDPEEFRQAQGVGEGEPDESVLRPEPLDPISAAIEQAFREKKP